mmetsp:Transcript_102402/g.219117  ORF Transcript_102402/g.219117 Transcript_102402/m.219117 type:complete len:319 (+) Transcript_102402:232-1188(+)
MTTALLSQQQLPCLRRIRDHVIVNRHVLLGRMSLPIYGSGSQTPIRGGGSSLCRRSSRHRHGVRLRGRRQGELRLQGVRSMGRRWRCGRRWGPAQGVAHAIGIGRDALEGVVAHTVVPRLAPVPVGAIAVALAHELRLRWPLCPQYLCQALVEEHVLTPQAEVLLLHALLRGLAIIALSIVRFQEVHCRLAHDLDGSMHTVPAIVDVRGPLVRCQDRTESLREEDAVRVCLYGPIVARIVSQVDERIPDCDEDPRVERRLGVAAIFALEVAVHESGRQAPCLYRFVAKESGLLAPEDARLVIGLKLNQLLFGAPRNHE